MRKRKKGFPEWIQQLYAGWDEYEKECRDAKFLSECRINPAERMIYISQ